MPPFGRLTTGLVALAAVGLTAATAARPQASKPAPTAQAAQAPAPLHMVHVYLCLLQAGPKRAQAVPEAEQLLFDHFDHLKRLMKSGTALVTGPVEGDA